MATLPRLVNAFFPNFKDIMGGQANCMWTTADQSDGGFGPFASVATATQNLSVCAVFAGVMQVRTIVGGVPSTGVYGTVSDQVVMCLRSETSSGQLVIPGPVDTIFLDDMQTVDLSNSLVTEWFGAVSSQLGDSYGSPWLRLTNGYRRKIRLAGT